MTVAYTVTDRQISDGPSWMSSDRFNIEAKAERPRTVVDRTGLLDRYDFNLRFVPDGVHLAAPGGGAAAISPDCSDAFAALPRQLGLNLEATKAPVEYLVVEHAEKPTEN